MGGFLSKCWGELSGKRRQQPKPDTPFPRVGTDGDIFGGSDDDFLDKVIDRITSLLKFHELLEQNKPQTIWSIPDSSRFKAVNSTIEKFSEISEKESGEGEVMKTIQGLLTMFGKAHWIAVGLLVVASVLERLEKASANKRECLLLLGDIHRLGKCVKQIRNRSDLNRGTMKDSAEAAMRLVTEGAGHCYNMILAGQVNRFRRVGADKAKLDSIKANIEKTYRDLMFHMGISIFDAASAKQANEKRIHGYPVEAVGINYQFFEIVDLLELGSPKNAVAVVLYGEMGMGKTTIAQAVFSGIQIPNWKFSKICLFEHRQAKPNIVELQKSLIKDLANEDAEINNYTEGQLRLQRILDEHDAFIFIDNVLEPNAIQRLLPKNLDRAKKLRLLLTAESEAIARILPVKDSRLKPVRAMAAEDVMEFMKKEFKELKDLNEERMKTLEDTISGISLAPTTVTVVTRAIKEADNKEQAYKEVVEELEKTKEEEKQANATPQEEITVMRGRRTEVTEANNNETAGRKLEMIAYKMLTEAAQKAFLDICAFFKGWECWRVESIVGEREFEELQKKGFLKKKVQQEEEYRTGVTRQMCRVEVPEAFLDMGLDMTKDTRFTDISKLEKSLLMRHTDDKATEDIEGIFLLQGKGYIAARDLESFQNSLRVLSIPSGLVTIRGKCKGRFNKLIFFEADDIDVPMQVTRAKDLKCLSYWPRGIVDLSKLPRTLRILSLRASADTQGLSFGRSFKFGEFEHLRSLLLNGFEEIKELPSSITKLAALKILNLSVSTSLEGLPQEIGKLTSLEELYLDGCESLESLPESTRGLKSLKVLSLNWCYSLSKLPADLGNLSMLLKLNLKRCKKLNSLPESIGGLKSLQVLNLKGCEILLKLPEQISNLKSLRFLYLWDDRLLSKLPAGLGKLKSLVGLELNGCDNLQRLPEGFGQLKSLRRLELWGCENLSELSDDFCNLPELNYLDMSSCKSLNVGKVSLQKILGMPKLKRLYIVDSPVLLQQWESLKKNSASANLVFTNPGSKQSKYRERKHSQQTEDDED